MDLSLAISTLGAKKSDSLCPRVSPAVKADTLESAILHTATRLKALSSMFQRRTPRSSQCSCHGFIKRNFLLPKPENSRKPSGPFYRFLDSISSLCRSRFQSYRTKPCTISEQCISRGAVSIPIDVFYHFRCLPGYGERVTSSSIRL